MAVEQNPKPKPAATPAAVPAPVLELAAECTVTIDKGRIAYDISSVELTQSVSDHHVLRIRLREVGKVSASQDFGDPTPYADFLGKSISVSIKPQGGIVPASKELGFIGVVTRIEFENSIDGINVVTIVAHSPTISMDGPSRNAFYHDQTASDIIGAIVRRYPITVGTVDSSQGTLKFSVQHRETDYEYVMRLAGGAGLFAFYDGKEFRAVTAKSSDVEELVWRETLGAFALGLGTSQFEYTSQAYNYEQKKTFTQNTKSVPPQAALSGLSKVSPDASKKLYPDPGFSTVGRLVADAQTLDQVLQRERNRAMGRMIGCHGQSIVPKVAPGHCVRIKGMDKIDATYWVKAVRHVFDESGKYHNTFECTPLDIAYPQFRSPSHPLTHLQMAVVLDNNDPDKLGRVKVKYPWNDSDETPWVRVMTPHAGKDRGWYSVPEIADEVLVGYELGSPDRPLVLGSLYNKDDKPPKDANTTDNSVKLFVTMSGHKILFNDAGGKEQISIITSGDKNKLVLDVSGPAVTIETQGSITMKAQQDITIEGQNITLDAKANLKVKAAANCDLEAGANMTAKANANHEIKGLMVTVTGTPIKLN
jgi:type VI secretion system secreted protein VgrG